jgi:hypothetical protein
MQPLPFPGRWIFGQPNEHPRSDQEDRGYHCDGGQNHGIFCRHSSLRDRCVRPSGEVSDQRLAAQHEGFVEPVGYRWLDIGTPESSIIRDDAGGSAPLVWFERATSHKSRSPPPSRPGDGLWGGSGLVLVGMDLHQLCPWSRSSPSWAPGAGPEPIPLGHG